METLRTPSIALLALALSSGCGNDESVGAALFDGDPELVLHEEQPMVADVRVRFKHAARLALSVAEDPGVRATPPEEAATEATVRLRGLAPDSHATLVLRASDAAGAVEERRLEFQSLPALPGFEPSFEVSGTASFDYSLFDMSVAPNIDESAVYAVEPAGRTRFHLPTSTALTNKDTVAKVPAGIKLLDDGRLLYLQDHHLRIVDELGERQLDFAALDLGIDGFHHDVLRLPSGNLLVIGYEFRNVTYVSDGQTKYVAGDKLVEITPAGQVVWQWSSFEHLDPQRIRDALLFPVINPKNGQSAIDWTHGNAIVYRASDDSILYSMRHQNWIVKIDHASGALAWRLGDEGDFTLASGSWFYHQHSPEWQPDGSLLIYDNGVGDPALALADQHSRPVRYEIDEATHVVKQLWDETNEKYLAIIAGDADRLPNGHVVVLDSSMPLPGGGVLDIYSRIREVDPNGNAWVWSLRSRDERFVFRAPTSSRLPGEPAQPAP